MLGKQQRIPTLTNFGMSNGTESWGVGSAIGMSNEIESWGVGGGAAIGVLVAILRRGGSVEAS